MAHDWITSRRNSLEEFEAKLNEIFFIHKSPEKELNTHVKFLNDLTIYEAYNLVASVINQIEKFRREDKPTLYIEPNSFGKPVVKECNKSRTMNDTIKFYHQTIANSKLADMSVRYYSSDSTDDVTRIVFMTISDFYNMFKCLTDIKNLFQFHEVIEIKLRDIASPFEWYGL